MPLIETNVDGVQVTNNGSSSVFKWEGNETDQYVAIQASDAWKIDEASSSIYYYEVFVKSVENTVGVGLAVVNFPTTAKMPGWLPGSYAYHGDDGNRFTGENATEGWMVFGNDDVVGIGLKSATGEIFGTLNGIYLGVLAIAKEKADLFPTIGFDTPGEVEVIFGKDDFKFDVSTLPETLTAAFGQLETTDRILDKLLVLYLEGLCETEREYHKGQLEAASKIAKSKYGYQSFYTTQADKVARGIREFAGVYDNPPVLLAINLEKNEKYAIKDAPGISTEGILSLLESIAAGQLTSLLKSAPRPPNDKNAASPTLTEVVATSFNELVIQSPEDVFLYVYADWCAPCRAIAPTIAILSEIFAENDGITIAKVDCDLNDINRKYLPETAIPNIKLFKKGNKQDPVKYQGNRSLDDIIDFLHANASVPFDLATAKRKGKQVVEETKKKLQKYVKHVESAEEFNTHLAASDKPVLVEYYATWCGPCQNLVPFYSKLSEEYRDVLFLKVDVDKLRDVAKVQEVTCMPTFKIYRNGTAIGSLEGADTAGLRKLITDNI